MLHEPGRSVISESIILQFGLIKFRPQDYTRSKSLSFFRSRLKIVYAGESLALGVLVQIAAVLYVDGPGSACICRRCRRIFKWFGMRLPLLVSESDLPDIARVLAFSRPYG